MGMKEPVPSRFTPQRWRQSSNGSALPKRWVFPTEDAQARYFARLARRSVGWAVFSSHEGHGLREEQGSTV